MTTKLLPWLQASPRRTNAAGWLVCGLLAAAFLSPGLLKGGFGPGDLLLSMTPWSQYRDRFAEIKTVHNPQLDVIQQYFPWRLYAAQSLRDGQVPLWNPHAYCGQPFVGNVLSAVFYPFTWLAIWLPIGRFFLLSAWVHLTLLGGGMWLLLRAYHLRWPAALTGAVVAMFNPFVVGWLHYAVVSQWTFAWAPLLLWSWHVAFRRRRPGGLAWTAAILALVLLGGHLQIALYVGLAWALYAVGSVALERRWRDAPLYLGVPGLLALGLAALQILPSLELTRYSGRQVGSYADTAQDAMPFRQLIGLLVPWFYGRNTLDYWGTYGNAIETSLGSGAVALLLAVCALVWRRDRRVWLFAAIALLGLLLAVRTPLYWLFWEFVPGVKALKGLSRALCLWTLGSAALAGFGVDALLRSPSSPCPKRTGVVLLAATAVALLAAWAGEAQRAAPTVVTAFTPRATSYVAGQCLVALLAAMVVGHIAFHRAARLAAWLPLAALLELGCLGFGMSTAVRPDVFYFRTPEIDFLSSRPEPSRMVGLPLSREHGFLDWMPMNTPLAFRLSSPSGSESLSFAPYRELLRAVAEPGWEPRLGSPLLNLLGVRYVLSRQHLEGQYGLHRVAGERVGVYENPAALPLCFATPRWRRLPPDATLAALTSPTLDPAEAILPPDGPQPDPSVRDGGVIVLRVAAQSPQRWAAEGRVSGPAVAVLTQARVPGWQAWVNGRRARIWPADRVFLAVELPPGPVAVRWVWNSGAYRAGLFTSLVALAIWWAWLAAHSAERKRRCE